MPAAGNTPGSSGVTGAGGAEFRRLLLATAISVFGSYAAAIALAVRTFEDTHQPAWVSAVFAAEFVPPVLLSGCRSLAAVPATEGPRRTPLRRLRRSARTIRRAAPLRQVVVAWMPVLLALGIVNSIEVPLLLGPLAAGAAGTGITIAAASAGQTLGSLIAPRLGERLGRRYPLVLGMIGATVVASGASPVVALVILLFIAGGIANGLAIVHNRSVVQRSAEADERAGLLALLMAAGGVMTAVGAAAGGAIASASTPRAAFVAAGA